MLPSPAGRKALETALREGHALPIVTALLEQHPRVAEGQPVLLDFALQRDVLTRLPNGVLHALLKANPAAAQRIDKDKYSLTPLYRAISAGASDDVVLALLDAWPQAAAVHIPRSRADADDLYVHCSTYLHRYPGYDKIPVLPLEAALRSPCVPSPAVVNALLSAHPAAARVPGRCGELPLHQALSLRAHSRERWLASFADRGAEGDWREFLARLDFKIFSADLTVVSAILGSFPGAAAVRDKHGNLPLHTALRHRAPLAVTRLLLDANKAAAAKFDFEGNLPVHRAAKRGASAGVLECVLAASPPGITEEAACKLYSRHLLMHALEGGCSEAAVRYLITASSGALLTVCNAGYSPLHHACSLRAHPSVLALLLALRPDAVLLRDSRGRLPLHHAARWDTRFRSTAPNLLTILAANPAAASVQCSMQGRTPLHEACLQSSDSSVDCDRGLRNGTLKPLYGVANCDFDRGLLPLYGVANLRRRRGTLSAAAAAKAARLLGAALCALEALIAACPTAAAVRDCGGSMPLRLAARHMPAAALELLLAAHPAAARAACSEDDASTPLAVALKYAAPRASVLLLLAAAPEVAAALRPRLRARLPPAAAIREHLWETALRRRMPALQAWAAARQEFQ